MIVNNIAGDNKDSDLTHVKYFNRRRVFNTWATDGRAPSNKRTGRTMILQGKNVKKVYGIRSAQQRKMIEETNLSQTIEAAGDLIRYDTNVKYLLADKQILSRILKYSISEFKDMSVNEIMNCITDDIEIGLRPVDAGLSNLGRINGLNTEDNIPGEGKIFRRK